LGDSLDGRGTGLEGARIAVRAVRIGPYPAPGLAPVICYFGAVVVAFIGGLILNIMPCVLPVISLKILSFVRQSHEHRSRVLALA